MTEDEGTFAVPGDESHESEETLSPDEGGEDAADQPSSAPKSPDPAGR